VGGGVENDVVLEDASESLRHAHLEGQPRSDERASADILERASGALDVA